MSEIITVGLDLAKNVFQVHGADGAGRPVLRKKLRRDRVLTFFSALQPCVVAMEASGGAHFLSREIGKLGHDVRIIPAAYVKPFVKRQKNDAADAIPTLKVLIEALDQLEAEILKLDTEITRRAKENAVARRLMTVPGVGPLIATSMLRPGRAPGWPECCHASLPCW